MNLERRDRVERRRHLQQYMLACLRDSVLSPSDLAQPGLLVDKLLRVISSDVRALYGDAKAQLRETGGNVARSAGSALVGMIGDIIGNRK